MDVIELKKIANEVRKGIVNIGTFCKGRTSGRFLIGSRRIYVFVF